MLHANVKSNKRANYILMFDFSNCVRETARSNPEHFCKYALLRIQIMMISNSNNSKNEYTIE